MQCVGVGWRSNKLLAALGEKAVYQLQSLFEPRRIVAKTKLERRGQEIDRVHFLTAGLASCTGASLKGDFAELAMVGREGMTGLALILGGTFANGDCIVRISGEALSIPRQAFCDVLKAHPEMKDYLLRYVKVHLTQVAETSIAHTKANVEQRLARVLLMCCDRLDQNHIRLTHEVLADMVGCRRATVTSALQKLDSGHAVHADRSSIIVVDRSLLEHLAGRFYGSAERDYERIMESARTELEKVSNRRADQAIH